MKTKIIILTLILASCFGAVIYIIKFLDFNNKFDPQLPSQQKTFEVSQANVIRIINPEEYWEDPRGVFPIIAYNLPETSNDLVGTLKVLAKSGINILVNSNMGWMPEPYKIKAAFKKLENSNLMWLAIIENECKDDFIFRNTNNKTNENIKKYLNDFNDSFIYGWYIWDEPGLNKKLCKIIPQSNNDFEDANILSKQIRADSLFSKKLDFVNLYPTYWKDFKSGIDYEKYIDKYFSALEYKPRILCADHYPILKKSHGGFRKDYFSNLDILSRKSLEYNVPFWFIVLTAEHEGYSKISFEDISLQVFSALAYGAKGIGYYTFSKSWEQVGYKSWILENYVDNPDVPDSLHGPLFVPVKELNKQIQVLGKILTNLESIEVIHSSNYPNKQKDITQAVFNKNQANSLIKDISAHGDTNGDSKLLIGVFEEKNNPNTNGKYLLIVNKDVAANSNISITLNNNFNIFRFNKINSEKRFVTFGKNLNENIPPGTGELFYIE